MHQYLVLLIMSKAYVQIKGLATSLWTGASKQPTNCKISFWINRSNFSWHLCTASCTGLYQSKEFLPNLVFCFFLNHQPDRIDSVLHSCKYWKITIVTFYWVETLSESQNAVSTSKVSPRCGCPFTFVCSMTVFTSQLQGWVTEVAVYDSKSKKCLYFGPSWKKVYQTVDYV